jgi:hypothetical protein
MTDASSNSGNRCRDEDSESRFVSRLGFAVGCCLEWDVEAGAVVGAQGCGN